MTNSGADLLRETTGTSHVAETLRCAVEIFAHFEIAHFVVGGLAVQEHGYYRVTTDVDVVVPNVVEARSALATHFSKTFETSSVREGRVVDSTTEVFWIFFLVAVFSTRGVLYHFPRQES